MAETETAGAAPQAEAGAPVAKDAIDPDLVKLRRTRPKIGMITAAGIVALCTVFILRLGSDRQYAGEPERAPVVAVSEIAAGRVDTNRHIRVGAEPLMAHALRAGLNKGDLGLRVVPVRGTADKVWIAVDGDGWVAPVKDYDGRLRKMSDMPFAGDLRDYAEEHARVVFATIGELRAGLAGGGKVKTVTGDVVSVSDTDRIAIDQVDPNASIVIASYGTHLPDANAWTTAIGKEFTDAPPKNVEPQAQLKYVRMEIPLPPAQVSERLTKAQLWARVDPVPRHFEGTVAQVRAGAIAFGGVTLPDTSIDLVGIYVKAPIPDDAVVLLVGDVPGDYWYVTPITLALLAIGLLFGWALVRAVRRDLLPTRA